MYRKILNVLFWILFVISIVLFVWILIGQSPTIDQLLVAITAGFFVKLNSDIGQIRERVGVLNEKVRRIELKLKL